MSPTCPSLESGCHETSPLHPVPIAGNRHLDHRLGRLGRSCLGRPDYRGFHPQRLQGNSTGSIAPSDLVTNQYRNLGILFPAVAVSPYVAYGTGVTQVGGLKVWAPVLSSYGGQTLDFGSVAFMTATLVAPGTNTPATTSSLTVEVVGSGANWVAVLGFNQSGKYLGDFMNTHRVGGHGGMLETLQAPGINSFATFVIGPLTGGDGSDTWGIAEIQTAPINTPEPGSMLLLGLGVLCLAGRAGFHHLPSSLRSIRAISS